MTSGTPAVSDIETQLRQATAELGRRLRAGEACTAEGLFAQFPDLAERDDAAVELIYAEFVLREELGPPPAADWPARFPRWRSRLERLLEVHKALHAKGDAESAVPLETPLPQAAPRLAGAGTDAEAARGYEILEEIGRGGMGVVYKARQRGLNRLVALKMVLAGDHAGPAELARFRTEAESAARLKHPGIVEIYEIGALNGHSFLALEYVDGPTLAQRLVGGALNPNDAATLIAHLAGAIQHAHERGVIHRDLKPSNILLVSGGVVSGELSATTTRHSPFTTHQPKITDFGLAKQLLPLSDLVAGDATRTGAVLGTPGYMAPEQAAGRGSAVRPAADIYALGAILYEALTGRPPFQGESPLDTLEQVRTQEPLPPRQLRPKLPKDLETVCLKCLQKEPHKRYATAGELEDDLGRYLRGESVRARPTPAWERAVKSAKRRPTVATLLAVLIVGGAAAFATVLGLWQQAESARAGEAHQRRLAEAQLGAKLVALAHRDWLAGDFESARQNLAECPPEHRDRQWRYLDRACSAERITFRGHSGGLTAIAFHPGGHLVASADIAGTLVVWELASGREVYRHQRGTLFGQTGLAFSRDGTELVWVYAPFRTIAEAVEGKASVVTQVFGVEGGDERRSFTRRGMYGPIVVSADGGHAACMLKDTAGSTFTVAIWETRTGTERNTWPVESGLAIALTVDGQYLAVAEAKRRILCLQTGSRKCVHALGEEGNGATAATFSPDGTRLAMAGADTHHKDVVLTAWQLPESRELFAIHSRMDAMNYIYSAAFSPDGKWLATASRDGSVILRDAVSGRELLTFRSLDGVSVALAFSPDGKLIASGSQNGTVHIWESRPPE